jgi:integrase
VFLDPTTVDELRSHRKRQAAERLAIGGDWGSSSNLVFSDELGGPVTPDWFSKEFDRLVQATGLPRLRLHDLRHTYATLALKAGIDRRSSANASVMPPSASPSTSTLT